MELDFTVVAVDVDTRAPLKDIGCYVHMEGELLDVITPIRDKIGQENTLTVAVSDRPKTLKMIVKRMGELEELLGSAAVPISVFAALPETEFSRMWVKLSNDPENDLFIPTTPEDIDRPRLQVAYRVRGKSTLPKSSSPQAPNSLQSLQQRIWDLEAELEVTKTELRYEQELVKDSPQDKERIKLLEEQLQTALESDTEEKYSEIVRQYRDYVEKQRETELTSEERIRELVEENSALKGELAAKQHQIATLSSEISYLSQCLSLEKAAKPPIPDPVSISFSDANEEITQLQHKLADLQAENSRLRKEADPIPYRLKETEPQPRNSPADTSTHTVKETAEGKNSPGETSVRTPKNTGKKVDAMEAALNAVLPKYGFQGKVTRVVEGIYLLGNRRIHTKMQGGLLLAQLGGTADWVSAEELLGKMKEETEAKSARRSCSVGQEAELPKEDPKPKAPSKLLRDFSPILKKKK